MKYLVFFWLVLTASIFSQQVNITFIVDTPGLPDTSIVYITGSNKNLGEWDPSAVPLHKTKDNRWTITIQCNVNEQVEYKFTRGSWDNEAADSNGAAPGNYIISAHDDTVLNYTITNWKDPLKNAIRSHVTGNVKYHYQLQSNNTLPRDIIVWLPGGYDADTILRYPVLYGHDGQNLFDPATSAMGTDWQLDEAADSLIRAGIIEPIIIVGIYNTRDRSKEYHNTDAGRAYMDFIINVLKPLIDSTYRTKPAKENTATIGSSSGGLISFMLAWEHPEVFSKAACLSPAFHPKGMDINYIPDVERVKEKKKVKLYIDNGGIGVEKILQQGVDEMLNTLTKLGYKYNTDLLYVRDINAEHNEHAWSKRVPNLLKFFFSK